MVGVPEWQKLRLAGTATPRAADISGHAGSPRHRGIGAEHEDRDANVVGCRVEWVVLRECACADGWVFVCYFEF